MEATIIIITALLFIAAVVIPTLATRLRRARTELRETREEANATLTAVTKERNKLRDALRTIEARRVIIDDTAPVPRTGEKSEMYQRRCWLKLQNEARIAGACTVKDGRIKVEILKK